MTETPSSVTANAQRATPAASTEQPAAAALDYAALLNEIPADVLRAHPRFLGVAGEYAARLTERERARFEAESQRKAQEEAEARLHKLAEEDPFSFSAEYLKQDATKQAHREIERLRQSEQETLMQAVGNAYGALPEWREIMSDPGNANRLAEAVAGRTGADIVAAFNATALDLVAERRASRTADSRVREKLDTEVEALVQERLAARLRGETVPEMSAARTMSVNQAAAILNMSDADFDRWYNRNVLR